MNEALQPGAILGVLGGGQLGRMFTLAARRMGYRVCVLAPEENTPAGQVANREIKAPYDDLDAVEEFACGVDVVTFEFENVPSAAVEVAARHAPVRPDGRLLHITQDRSREKRCLNALGLPIARFEFVKSLEELEDAVTSIGLPAILKTTASGYDGHGQRRIDRHEDVEPAWRALEGSPCVLERLIPFHAELSVIGARGVDGQIALYEPTLNRHSNHVLDVTLCPAPLPDSTRLAAKAIAREVLTSLKVVGVLCVELFLLDDGSLLVNELAPRPHNSGHVTLDAHVCSQFEQQVRAVCGLPLGTTERRVPAAAMANLLGEHWSSGTPNWSGALSDPGIRLHLYGKDDPRPGRKMGHLAVCDQTADEAARRVLAAREVLEYANNTGASPSG